MLYKVPTLRYRKCARRSPTIRIAAPDDAAPLDAAVASAATFDWIIFASANAVDSFMSRLLAEHDVRELKGVRIGTVGPSTASRLQRYGVKVDLTPAEYRARFASMSVRQHDDVDRGKI